MGKIATLFNDPPEVSSKKIRGRNPDLHAQRNECLADRYYYYSKIKSLRYDKILSILSIEFFLGDRTIGDQLREVAPYLISLKKNPITVKELEEKYPWLKFN